MFKNLFFSKLNSYQTLTYPHYCAMWQTTTILFLIVKLMWFYEVNERSFMLDGRWTDRFLYWITVERLWLCHVCHFVGGFCRLIWSFCEFLWVKSLHFWFKDVKTKDTSFLNFKYFDKVRFYSIKIDTFEHMLLDFSTFWGFQSSNIKFKTEFKCFSKLFQTILLRPH